MRKLGPREDMGFPYDRMAKRTLRPLHAIYYIHINDWYFRRVVL